MTKSQLKQFIEENILKVALNTKKTKDKPKATTPFEDGFEYKDLSEIDVCMNIKYENIFVKVNFTQSRSTYKIFVYDIDEVEVWEQFRTSWFNAIIQSRRTKPKIKISLPPTSEVTSDTDTGDW